MIEEREPLEDFPCYLSINGERLEVHSEGHYVYLNDKADMLYQTIYGYMSQPDFDYYCSTHPQESNCFCVALVMDDWAAKHDFNNQ